MALNELKETLQKCIENENCSDGSNSQIKYIIHLLVRYIRNL